MAIGNINIRMRPLCFDQTWTLGIESWIHLWPTNPFVNARDGERVDNVQYASRYRARLLIKTTSLVKVPLAYASHLPSGDQPNEKIGLGLQCVNCFGAPPSSG